MDYSSEPELESWLHRGGGSGASVHSEDTRQGHAPHPRGPAPRSITLALPGLSVSRLSSSPSLLPASVSPLRALSQRGLSEGTCRSPSHRCSLASGPSCTLALGVIAWPGPLLAWQTPPRWPAGKPVTLGAPPPEISASPVDIGPGAEPTSDQCGHESLRVGSRRHVPRAQAVDAPTQGPGPQERQRMEDSCPFKGAGQ